MYINHKSDVIRWKIIESLASSGGPNSLETLNKINDLEQDANLKKQISTFINSIVVTTQ